MERTDLPVSKNIGFMDGPGIPHGGDWRDEVMKALATCRVFVPLYSPRYFTRAECGIEWHAFAQRMLDHSARHPNQPAAIVPALWTPVRPQQIPDPVKRIQVNHEALGIVYAEQGFYTLIKNTYYRQEYITAVQRLAVHIIQAAESMELQPCRVHDMGPLRNAFEMSAQHAPGDRRLNLIVAAATRDRLPDGRCGSFYGRMSSDWNPFHPGSRQSIIDYAAGVARLNSYEPAVLRLDEGYDVLRKRDPSAGLGVLLVDAWASVDEEIALQLAGIDAMDIGWVGAMVLWNMNDAQTKSRAEELRRRLGILLPKRFGEAGCYVPVNCPRVGSLEEFRKKLPEVLEAALLSYLNHAEAHPPLGEAPPRPTLAGPDAGRLREENEGASRDDEP
jgi:FxsC-like protein